MSNLRANLLSGRKVGMPCLRQFEERWPGNCLRLRDLRSSWTQPGVKCLALLVEIGLDGSIISLSSCWNRGKSRVGSDVLAICGGCVEAVLEVLPCSFPCSWLGLLGVYCPCVSLKNRNWKRHKSEDSFTVPEPGCSGSGNQTACGPPANYQRQMRSCQCLNESIRAAALWCRFGLFFFQSSITTRAGRK